MRAACVLRSVQPQAYPALHAADSTRRAQHGRKNWPEQRCKRVTLRQRCKLCMRTEGPCTKGVPSALKNPKGMQIVRHHRRSRASRAQCDRERSAQGFVCIPCYICAWSGCFTGSMRTRPDNPGIYLYPVLHMRMVWKLCVIICRRTCCRSVGPSSNCGSSTDLNIETPEETGPNAARQFGPYCASASGIAIIESSRSAPMQRNQLSYLAAEMSAKRMFRSSQWLFTKPIKPGWRLAPTVAQFPATPGT